MALAHTILASLAECSRSGYDLGKRFDECVSCYWKASTQQIYRELAKLEAQGWISSEIIPQSGRPDKKVYHLTELGHKNLIQWIVQPSEPTDIREDLLVKVLAGYLVPRQVILTELERRRQIHLERLAMIEELAQQDFQNKGLTQHDFQNPEELALENKFFYLNIRRGIRYESAWVEWCDEAIALLS